MSKTLLKEIRNIAVITAIFGIIQILITIPAGYFGLPAVLGTLLGYVIALANFTLMGIVLEQSMTREKGASGLMGIGYILRLAVIAAVIIWAMKVEYINYVCAVIPLLFPQVAIFIINALRKKEGKTKDNERT